MKKQLITAAAIAVLLSGCASHPTSVYEPFQAQDLNPLLTSGQYVQKTDNFFVINDSSGSMSDKYKGPAFTAQPDPTKFSVEREVLRRMNQTIPDLKLTSSIRSFGFGPCLDNHFTKLNMEPTAYTKEVFSAGVDALECSGGGSPLDDGIVGSTADLSSTSGQIAVLVMSDGHDLDSYGTKEIAAMKSAYGDRLCVYGVWTGNPEEISGLAVLNQLSSIAGCGFAVSSDVVSTPEGMARFVKSIFLKPAVVPAAPPRELHVNVQFDNDEYSLEHSSLVKNNVNGLRSTPEEVKHDLDVQVSSIMANPDTRYEVQGHTNYTGKEARNIILGEGRAQTIYSYLLANYPGVDQHLIAPKGYSWNCPDQADPRSPQNRRVDLELNGGCQHTAMSTAELKANFGSAELRSGNARHARHARHHHRR
jgi:OOP family OmpA-OmpF porin